MKIHIATEGAQDFSAYYAEIFHANGLLGISCAPLQESLRTAVPSSDVVVLQPDAEAEGVESFLAQGGTVVAVLPGPRLEALAGISRISEDADCWNLRFAQAFCKSAHGEPLWTIGPVRLYESRPGPDVIAYLSHPAGPESDTIGILECPAGNGTLIVYAYDPARCIARLRQGDPARAGAFPPGQRTPRSAFLQQPDPPSHTFWRPTADLHALGLCEIVQRRLAKTAPVPLLWHLPSAAPSILIFSGDEDNGEQSANDAEMCDLEASGGAMSLYVIPDMTSITRSLMEEYTRRGHTISVHPNMVPLAAEPVSAQVDAAEAQVRMFREKFQWPARTVRNHFYMWPGYLELPELWERLGIGMDANSCATRHFAAVEYGPFLNVHAGRPFRFVRENGTLIDVFQQPTHANDDLQAHPSKFYSQKYSEGQFSWIVERMFEDAVRFSHSPLCVNVHPVNHASFAGGHARVLIAKAAEFGMPIWSLDRWHDFWRARSSWRMLAFLWGGEILRISLEGPPSEGLSLVLPGEFHRKKLASVLINEKHAGVGQPSHDEPPACRFTIPDGCGSAEFVARYL